MPSWPLCLLRPMLPTIFSSFLRPLGCGHGSTVTNGNANPLGVQLQELEEPRQPATNVDTQDFKAIHGPSVVPFPGPLFDSSEFKSIVARLSAVGPAIPNVSTASKFVSLADELLRLAGWHRNISRSMQFGLLQKVEDMAPLYQELKMKKVKTVAPFLSWCR